MPMVLGLMILISCDTLLRIFQALLTNSLAGFDEQPCYLVFDILSIVDDEWNAKLFGHCQ